ncbi:hypothetical protein FE783_15255 [Paenibacillus mesophilus]|uniref:hypothetical protein n=1 Tax=Paenibacillus mesophilus TaxID=2582849 RepID=UPI00110D52EB|nr:hypothetical protein [Paenibacillus mesophilus]TMV49026.1 hypothetical protein FE783_15255 [Paenibacillus mesophilus]
MRRKRSKRRRRWPVWLLGGVVLAGLAAGGAACVFDRQKQADVQRLETVKVDGISMPARTGDHYIQVRRNGVWQDLLIKGVNMGVAKPGHFPGETAITKEEYARWFKQIGDMHANAVRVYTLHPPAFYEALKEYNDKADEPVMVLHGVWVDEEKLVETGDAYSVEVNEELQKELRDMVNVIHGKADLPARPGHASGKYGADISNYVLGWVLGIEWDPIMVDSTNKKREGTAQLDGTYFRTEQASPFEVWVAKLMEDVAVYEMDTYKWQRPFSFTNWVTTDPMRHPSEPAPKEDMVSVDPNAIVAKPALKSGYFASYHVYPYYPEFMNYEQKYAAYTDSRGETNRYAGYLHDLKQSHRMPVLVAEFGVPASRGMTHRNVSGWNQGHLTEEQQGAINARLFEDIYREGMAGGLVFTWQDEWFKRTWNTMDLDNPDRRPFWSNAQTSEQQFGLLGFDPNAEGVQLLVDGDTKDWEKAGIPLLNIGETSVVQAVDEWDAHRRVDRVASSADERYVYLRLDFGKDGRPFDWRRVRAMIMLDTIPGQGQQQLPGSDGATTDGGFDFVIDIGGPDHSRVWVDSYYDAFYYQYGHTLNMIPPREYAQTSNNGRYHTLQLALNKALTIPDSGLKLPFDAYETGLLRFGNGNPASKEYDSLADVFFDEKEHVLEARIAWQLLNVKDPSTREVMGDIWKEGLAAKQTVPGFKFAVAAYKPGDSVQSAADEEPALDPGTLTFVYPALKEGKLSAEDMIPLVWPTWEQPRFHERLKQSYYAMKDVFGRIRLP